MQSATKYWTALVTVSNVSLLGYLTYLVSSKNCPVQSAAKLFGISVGISLFSIICCSIGSTDRLKFTIRRLYIILPFYAGISTLWITFGLLNKFQLEDLSKVHDIHNIVIALAIQGALLTFWWCYSTSVLISVIIIKFRESVLRPSVLSLYSIYTVYSAFEICYYVHSAEKYLPAYNAWNLTTIALEFFVVSTLAFYLTEELLATREIMLRKKDLLKLFLFVIMNTFALSTSLVVSKVFVRNKKFMRIEYYSFFNDEWNKALLHLGVEGILLILIILESSLKYFMKPSRESESLLPQHAERSDNSVSLELPGPQGNSGVENSIEVGRALAVGEQEQTEQIQSIFFAKQCCICREEYTDRAKVLRCGHMAHKECLGEWFRRKKNCPTCKMDVA